MKRTYEFRLYPTKAQTVQLGRWLESCCELYNAALQERRDSWNMTKLRPKERQAKITRWSQSAQLPEIRKVRVELGAVNSQVLQNVIRRVDLAFESFFRRAREGGIPGYPRFKSPHRYDSLTFPQSGPRGIGFHVLKSGKLKLPGIGSVRIKTHRPIEGRMKTCSVKRESGKWYAYIVCDDVPAQVYPPATAEIGIDMGLESFATFSTGEQIENPRWYRKTEFQIKEANRELSRKKRGSNRRKRAKLKVARVHAKARNQRKDYHHKLAHRLATENALIVAEDLKPQQMREHTTIGMAKSIQDASWGNFLTILEVKAEEAGRKYVKVNPANTSRTCSRCGAYKKKELWERTHDCPCGLVIHRDINSAKYILRLGQSLQTAHASCEIPTGDVATFGGE